MAKRGSFLLGDKESDQEIKIVVLVVTQAVSLGGIAATQANSLRYIRSTGREIIREER